MTSRIQQVLPRDRYWRNFLGFQNNLWKGSKHCSCSPAGSALRTRHGEEVKQHGGEQSVPRQPPYSCCQVWDKSSSQLSCALGKKRLDNDHFWVKQRGCFYLRDSEMQRTILSDVYGSRVTLCKLKQHISSTSFSPLQPYLIDESRRTALKGKLLLTLQEACELSSTTLLGCIQHVLASGPGT